MKLRMIGISAAALLGCAAPILAQDQPPPPEEGNVQIGRAIAVSSDGSAGGITVFSSDTMGGFDLYDTSNLITRPDVRSELGLVDDQINQIQEMQKAHRDAMRQQLKSAFGGPNGQIDLSRAKEMAEFTKKANEELKTKINGLLLPHQQKRLNQIGYHLQMRDQGTDEALLNGKLAEELGLTDEQKKELKEKAEEIKTETEKAMAKLRKEARDKIFAVLNKEQQEKLKDLLGSDFESKEPAFGPRRFSSSLPGLVPGVARPAAPAKK